jgi:hypothetical protein
LRDVSRVSGEIQRRKVNLLNAPRDADNDRSGIQERFRYVGSQSALCSGDKYDLFLHEVSRPPRCGLPIRQTSELKSYKKSLDAVASAAAMRFAIRAR